MWNSCLSFRPHLIFDTTDRISIQFVIGVYNEICLATLILVHIGQLETPGIFYIKLKYNFVGFIRNC
jgi:hypothetical protein